MLLTKEQIYRLYCFLNVLADDNVEIKHLEIIGSDILLRAEPIKGEIENRVWKITPEGELIPSLSFFYD